MLSKQARSSSQKYPPMINVAFGQGCTTIILGSNEMELWKNQHIHQYHPLSGRYGGGNYAESFQVSIR